MSVEYYKCLWNPVAADKRKPYILQAVFPIIPVTPDDKWIFILDFINFHLSAFVSGGVIHTIISQELMLIAFLY